MMKSLECKKKDTANRVIRDKKGDKMDISEAVKVIALYQF